MKAYIAEFLGSLFFIGTIRATSGNPIWIGLALAIAVFLTAGISGGNLNPAVSVLSYVTGSLSAMDTLWYTLAQVAAAVVVSKTVPVLMR